MDANEWVPQLNNLFVRYDITTPKRIVAFIAQAAVQTDNFTILVEYTTCPNTTYPWGWNRWCDKYAGGCKYKGRGILHIHGEDFYSDVSVSVNIDLTKFPCYMSRKAYAFQTSGYFWWINGMNNLAERGAWDLITQKISRNQPDHWDKRLAYLAHVSHCYRPKITDTSKCGFTYTCTEGDTIETITTRYRMLPTEIFAVNNIPANFSSCAPNQQLYIPMLCGS